MTLFLYLNEIIEKYTAKSNNNNNQLFITKINLMSDTIYELLHWNLTNVIIIAESYI